MVQHSDIDHTGLTGITSGAVGTDAIWDAAGDLAVGTGADTAARLAIGSVGSVLGRVNGAVAWNGGTSFPASKATSDRFYRSDLAMEFYWDGTRWLAAVPVSEPIPVNSIIAQPYAATQNGAFRTVVPQLQGGSDIYLTNFWAAFHVASGGSALSASHKWVITLNKTGTGTSSTIGTVNIDSGNSNEWRAGSGAISALMNNGTTHHELDVSVTKTGTPGNLSIATKFGYRIVAT